MNAASVDLLASGEDVALRVRLKVTMTCTEKATAVRQCSLTRWVSEEIRKRTADLIR
jgi:hypothetical protein